jgi:acyl-CoA reductase-like NAD-dependent aldehyde dehydrogenase
MRMAYIQAGKDEGATVHLGGERHGTEGYFLSPTVFTFDVKGPTNASSWNG